MCGRYQLNLDPTAIADLQKASWREGHAERHNARNEVRPTTQAPVYVRGDKNTTNVALMRWSIRSVGVNSQMLINARQETLMEKPTFRNALRKGGRCVVPSSGFYEWYKPIGGGKGSLEPFLVRRKGTETLLMAGLYEVRETDAGPEEGFVIITTAACGEFAWLHDRQPCFLEKHEVSAWLDDGEASILNTRGGVSWTRMVNDLSRASENQAKPRKQSSIASFFGTKRSDRDGKQKDEKKKGVAIKAIRKGKPSKR